MTERLVGFHRRIAVGEHIAPLEMTAISGRIVIPDPHRLTHLQFRRFAGCPVCDLHLHMFARRYAEIERAGVRQVVLFHSSEEDLRALGGDLPFTLVADPDKLLYAQFGVEADRRALSDPRAWPYILLGVLRSLVQVMRGRQRMPPVSPRGGSFGLPADFLIAPDGTVLACKYGDHAYDQWSVDELLDLARAAAPDATTGDMRPEA